MDNEWKNSLRERFSDYSAPEPEGLWEGIEQGISEKPRRKMLPVWLVSGAAVAAAVALVVFLHPEKTLERPLLQERDKQAESVLADVALPEPVAADTASAEVEALVPAEVSKSVPFAVASRQTLLSEAASVPPVPVDEDRVPDTVHQMPDQVGHDVPVIDQVERDEPVVSEKKEAGKTLEETPVPESEEIKETKEMPDQAGHDESEPARKRFSIGAYGNGGQASAEQAQGYGMNRTSAYLTRSTGGTGIGLAVCRKLAEAMA